jgi:SAM-dependent methyltransferase
MQTATPSPVQSTPDLAAIKQKQQATWACGDYAVVGTTLQIVGETLAEAADVRGGERVLDVAAGNGNASLAAARRFASVVSTDYVSTLLDKGAQRARAEGLAIAFQVADVEDLPFADGSFDLVLSTFGAMFAPDHQRTASEMLRVLRPGGRLGMANWTPEGFIGQLFKLIGRTCPPPAGLQPPSAVGHRGALRGAVRHGRDDPLRDEALQLPLPLGRPLRADLPRLVRPDAQGLRRPRAGRPASTGGGPARPARQAQHRRPGLARRSRASTSKSSSPRADRPLFQPRRTFMKPKILLKYENPEAVVSRAVRVRRAAHHQAVRGIKMPLKPMAEKAAPRSARRTRPTGSPASRPTRSSSP